MQRRDYTRVIIHQFDPEVPSPGGTDTCIRDMLKFIPRGERVLVIGVSESRPLNRIVQIETFPTGFDFLPVSRATSRKQARIAPHSIRLLAGLTRALVTHRLRATVLQIHRLEPGLLVGLFKPKRTNYFVHTNVRQALSSNSDSFWRKAPGLYRRLEKLVLSRSDLLVVFNQITADVYAARGENVERMRTWYNETIFYPRHLAELDDVEHPTLLWVGRIEAPKDPHLAIETFRSLREQTGEKWRMSILGHGTLRAQMQERVRQLGIEDAVTFHGAVSREAVGEHMRHADVLLMTSHFEGSPRVLYESMGCGLPVVATSEGDPDAVIINGTNGFVIEERNPEEFGKAIETAAGLRRDYVARSVSERQASSVLRRLWQATGTRQAQ